MREFTGRISKSGGHSLRPLQVHMRTAIVWVPAAIHLVLVEELVGDRAVAIPESHHEKLSTHESR